MMSKVKSVGTRRVPQPSAGARRRGAKRPELLVLEKIKKIESKADLAAEKTNPKMNQLECMANQK